ncbi:acyl transferase/acyl hydrolase/lysophospholipase [Polychytrium aggregatum]|uniref:acyl transferase/acyl hydrolase/lysophospholipase n=1 Tax=Polychytrium aggregatum TaxID=110093 RepID=UPI0022FE0C21|nr:acyl transferase/acyl hydrolase/lysophospholipase [Polychytrium aggregatum]KAI9204269.1 acyl transferase/acyl hydrolase/lysophospholipase [Polychytrium aggregatum]
MGKDIYDEFAVAREVIDEADSVVGGGLKTLMFEGPQPQLTLTSNAQPAILAHSIALFRVLEKEYGSPLKNCEYVMGHSLGEYTALVATSSLKLEDAVRLVKLRGETMQQTTKDVKTIMQALVIKGNHLHEIEALMAKIQINLPAGEVAEIANINSRKQIVLSGTVDGIENATSLIQSKGYSGRAVTLPVSAPFHCRLMAPAAELMKNALMATNFKLPQVEVISNVTARPFDNAGEIGYLLYRQIAETVQWYRSLQYAFHDEVHEFVCIGPSKALSNLLKKDHPELTSRSICDIDDIRAFGKLLAERP